MKGFGLGHFGASGARGVLGSGSPLPEMLVFACCCHGNPSHLCGFFASSSVDGLRLDASVRAFVKDVRVQNFKPILGDREVQGKVVWNFRFEMLRVVLSLMGDVSTTCTQRFGQREHVNRTP